jgi:hypothetical protein
MWTLASEKSGEDGDVDYYDVKKKKTPRVFVAMGVKFATIKYEIALKV